MKKVCKGCGCYLRQRNVTGRCRDCQPSKARALRRCSVCDTQLGGANKSGLCAAHHIQARVDGARGRDQRIIEALTAGHSRSQVAAAMGLSIHTIHRIADRLPPKLPTRRLADIVAAAARIAGVSRDDIIGPSRFRKFTLPRQVVCLLAMEAGHSSSRVAAYLDRDHSTVLHGREAAKALAQLNADFAAYVERVRKGEDAEFSVTAQPVTTVSVPSRPAPLPVARSAVRAAAEANKASREDEDEFSADIDENVGRAFHRNIVAGSIALRRAIELARAA